jgi:hypothetical protein
MAREVVQVLLGKRSNKDVLYALCNDGSLFSMEMASPERRWVSIPSPPQPQPQAPAPAQAAPLPPPPTAVEPPPKEEPKWTDERPGPERDEDDGENHGL